MSTIDDKAAALLERPSLEGLAYALRHREVWPKGFAWDYFSCANCAMGLSHKLWQQITSPTSAFVAPVLDITSREASWLFLERVGSAQMPLPNVTPEHVADAIDALLARRA